MPDTLPKRFTDAELSKIMEEASIYMCACPAQVAESLTQLRALYKYQRNCIQTGSLMMGVHDRIARATAAAHQEMECCLDDVLAMEGWDRATLTMPEGLRQRRDELLNGDD
ncbi:MAG: hypothetical protein HXY26_07520 [Hydrogenophilaceae bacterium]|nr:hypothetical protein [Hydrogenophilaceae bacterium]